MIFYGFGYHGSTTNNSWGKKGKVDFYLLLPYKEEEGDSLFSQLYTRANCAKILDKFKHLRSTVMLV